MLKSLIANLIAILMFYDLRAIIALFIKYLNHERLMLSAFDVEALAGSL